MMHIHLVLVLYMYVLYTDGMKLSGQVLLTVELKPISNLLKQLSMPNIGQKSGCQHQLLVSFH